MSPPSAERLVSALSAPGFDSNWARGIAAANELGSAETADDELAELLVGDDPPPVPLLLWLLLLVAVAVLFDVFKDVSVAGNEGSDVALPSCAKFAFCSSTLREGNEFRSRNF